MARETYAGPVAYRADVNDGRGGYVVLPAEGVEEYETEQAEVYEQVEEERAKTGRKDRVRLGAFSTLALHPHSEISVDHDWDEMQQAVWVPDADGIGGHFELVGSDEDASDVQQAILDEHASQSQT